MVVLVAVSVGALDLVLPISIAIAAVLAIVVVSYTQTVRAYETSGGAYVVAKENLGTLPSLVAGSRAPRGLRPHGRRLRHGGRARADVGGAVTRAAQGRALARVRGAADGRQPPWCPRVRSALRHPDVRLRRGHVRHDRDGRRPVPRRGVPAGGRSEPARGRHGSRRRARHPAGLRIRVRGPDRRRGDLERRRRVPSPQGPERRAHARSRWARSRSRSSSAFRISPSR